jgi:hypothetical protein
MRHLDRPAHIFYRCGFNNRNGNIGNPPLFPVKKRPNLLLDDRNTAAVSGSCTR